MGNECTYSSRLGCDNCGHAEEYEFPVRSIITNYSHDERTPSSYHLQGSPEENLVNCKHCKLPHLQVLWWKEDQEISHANV